MIKDVKLSEFLKKQIEKRKIPSHVMDKLSQWISMSTKKIDKFSAEVFLEKFRGRPLNFSDIVRSTRLGEEMTQAAFAKQLKISRSHLNDIEKGRKVVSPGRAARFAKILGYSEVVWVGFALQAILDKDGLKLKASVEAA